MTNVNLRVHLVNLMNADWELGGSQPSDQAKWLGLWVCRKLAAKSTSTIAIVIITQPISWCSFYHPMEGERLSRPGHCSKGAQPMPKAVYCSGCRDKHNRLWCDSNLWEMSNWVLTDGHSGRFSCCRWVQLGIALGSGSYNTTSIFGVGT